MAGGDAPATPRKPCNSRGGCLARSVLSDHDDDDDDSILFDSLDGIGKVGLL